MILTTAAFRNSWALASVAFVPASSLLSGTITVAGTVAVSNFPASQPVTGPLTAAELLAMEPLPVTGPLTAAQLAAAQPLSVTGPLTSAQLVALEPLAVTGPLTDAQLAARLPLSIAGPVTQGTSPWVVDGSAVTQPVSAESLPLPEGAADNETLSEVALTSILTREAVNVE